MWYKKSDFPEYNVFHGTGNQNSIYDRGFLYDYVGNGVEQYGPGFYFTSNHQTASRYTTNLEGLPEGKRGGEDSPGIIKAKINLNKPIHSDGDIESSVMQIFPKLSISQARQMINLAVKIRGDQILHDWGDMGFERKENIINNAAQSYAGRPSSLLMYDLFDKPNLEQALRFITKATGYDGVVVSLSNEQWVIAWYPEQIQVIR